MTDEKQYITTEIELGSIVYTPEQQRRYKERKEILERQKTWRKMIGELGSFYFLSCDNDFDKLSPATVARLIYLCTYLSFDGRFVLTQRRHLQKSDLCDIMQLSKSAIYNFLNEVMPRYITEDDEGLILADDKVIRRGDLGKDNHNFYERLYIDAIRRLYRQTDATHHRHLGYVFVLLPYINIDYNLLCHNPFEKDIDYIDKLTITDFCKVVGYNPHNYRQLLDIYEQITFPVDGHREYFLSYVAHGNDIQQSQLFVNPRILYCGSNYRKVEVLGAFTKVIE